VEDITVYRRRSYVIYRANFSIDSLLTENFSGLFSCTGL